MADSSSKTSADADRFEQYLVAGGELLRRDAVEEAIGELSAALELFPEDERALGLLGLSQFRLSAFAEAHEVYAKLCAINPNDASYRLNLGLVHLKMGKAEEAIGELRKSRELDPSQPRTVSYLGLAYARSGQYASAYEAFLRAGQTALASEMEQYLDQDERQSILSRVSGGDEVEAGAVVGEVAAETAAAVTSVDAAADRDEVAAAPVAGDDAGAQAAGEVADEADADATAAAAPPADDDAAPQPEDAAPPADDAVPPADDAVPPADDAVVVAEGSAPIAAAIEPAITADPAPAANEPPAATAADTADASDAAAPRPVDALAEGMITRAVADAAPSSVAADAARRTAVGHRPPQPLGEFATAALVRPEDGDHAFEIGAGGVLVVRVDGRVLSRTEGVIVSSGELGFEPAARRVRGAQTSEFFGGGSARLFVVTGSGYLIAGPRDHQFAALRLDEDILYLREELVFAFDEQLHWESGHVPGSESSVRVVQFRGSGCVAIKTRRPLLSIKLSGERVMYVDADVLAGWVGRVIPRLVKPAAGGRSSTPFVECSGEGVVLLQDQTEL